MQRAAIGDLRIMAKASSSTHPAPIRPGVSMMLSLKPSLEREYRQDLNVSDCHMTQTAT